MSLPDRALSNVDLKKAVKGLKIKKFRGVFMKDALPKKPLKYECGILNLDSSSGSGTHWECWIKRGKSSVTFDSYGLNPPTELANYLKDSNTYNNTAQVQKNGHACGHFCLFVLKATSDCNERNLLQVTQSSINKLF